MLGRIKVPTQGALTDKEWLARVLRHEYVHALIHERMGMAAGAVPTWLNEGLAMQLAGDTWPEISEVSANGVSRLIPLPALAGSWSHLSSDAATLAYLEANSATGYLIQRYGLARVGKILDSLKAGNTMPQAVEDILMVSYETFQRRWKGSLKMAASGNRGTPHPSFN